MGPIGWEALTFGMAVLLVGALGVLLAARRRTASLAWRSAGGLLAVLLLLTGAGTVLVALNFGGAFGR